MTDDWEKSAEAWIADMGEDGDWGRRHVLDRPMTARAKAGNFRHALDVGCGEGRFCRALSSLGIAAIGLDPVARLCEEAQKRHPSGDYRIGKAEALPFTDGAFDLVVSYLSLIDIEDYAGAISEMARVLAPGGSLLVANLTALTTARAGTGWEWNVTGGDTYFKIDHYMDERSRWERFAGIEIRNWHRPLAAYMREFLKHDLTLRFFDEPLPHGGNPDKAAKYARAPWYVVMEWSKAR